MIRINLAAFLAKEGKSIVASYKRLMQKKQGVRLDSAPRNAPNYARTKPSGDHWLVNTGETKRKGFILKVTARSIRVSASQKRHSGRRYYHNYKTGERSVYTQKNPPTYEQIFKWHNQDRYSGVFGQLPVGSKFPDRLVMELSKQIAPQIADQFPKRRVLKIGRGWRG